MKTAYVYIMANQTRTMYVGVTNNLERRVWEHKHQFNPGSFTSRYKLTKLVYTAEYSRMDDAIAYEKVLKGRSRTWKMKLIEETNPRWNDLAWNWFEEKPEPPSTRHSEQSDE